MFLVRRRVGEAGSFQLSYSTLGLGFATLPGYDSCFIRTMYRLIRWYYCCDQVCTIPLDTAKVRLQLQKKAAAVTGGGGGAGGVLGTMMCIAREEGVAALWKGIIPGLHRQCLYGGLRIGLYEPVCAPSFSHFLLRRHSPLSFKVNSWQVTTALFPPFPCRWKLFLWGVLLWAMPIY